MEITTSEFFCNMKKLPPPGSKEFIDLIKWEEEKIKGGVWVNGVFITPWLYWHLNHWKIRMDGTDQFGNEIRVDASPILRDNEWIRAEALERCRVEKKGYMEIGGRQGGKELADYEPLIKDGEISSIGNAKIGDKIYSNEGKLCNITGVFPQGIKPIYRIYFIDGRYIDAGLNHLWEVYDCKNQKYIKTTEQLLNSSLSFKHKKSGNSYKYAIPNTQEVEFSKKDLKIDPYILGALLGDGCTSVGTNTINCMDEEIINEFRKRLPEYEIKKDKSTNVKHTIVYKGKKRNFHNENPLNQALKELNLKCKASKKFIPEIYKYSSIEDRYELLRGLFDTDGSINENGSIEIKLSSKQLIDDIEWVLRSLGIQCQQGVMDVRGKIQILPNNRQFVSDHLYYRLFVKTDKPIFKLKRKLNRLKPRKRRNVTSITRIEYLGVYSATCITVDSPDHLFLTKDFIVTHNSEMEASYFSMNAIMFQNTQNVIVCGNDNDLSLLKDKVDFGLKNVWEGLNIPRLDKTWKSNQIRLGYKKPNGDDDIWSYIVIRNAKDGHNTEVSAGTTAKSFIMDEVGKYPFAQAYEAGVPAMKGVNGFRAVPILVGTGGAFDNGKDAENFFYNPKANNFLSFKDEKTNKETGLFMSGLYRQDCKEEKTLDKFLIEDLGRELKGDISELKKIKIQVSNKEKAKKIIEQEREAAKKNPDKVIYLKKVMYYPLTVDECFLSNSDNIFDIEAAKRQKSRLLTQERTGVPVILYADENGIKHEFTDKLPITNFPLKPTDDKDAPVVIYEFPVENAPYGLYVAGCDPYRQGKAAYSSSLGAIYIYKRMHSLTGEKYQDMFVASYVARPDKKEKWHEQARLLIKYYNARALVENDEISFIDYMLSKGDGHYLEKAIQWIKEIVPNTTTSREYGVHRSADKIRDHLHTKLKNYLEEELVTEKDENGNITRQVIGVHRILDPLLLEEIIQYNEEGNFDRLVAAELAITQATKMDPVFGKISDNGNTISLKKQIKKKPLFNENKGLFNRGKRKLFI